MIGIAEIVVVRVVPMWVVMAVEVAGIEAAAVAGRILIPQCAIVGPDIVPGFAHGIQTGVAGNHIRTVGTAHIDSEVLRYVPNVGFKVRVGKNVAGSPVGTVNVDFQIFDGGMFHFDAQIEDVVGVGDGRARGKFCEGDVGTVVDAIGWTADAIGEKDSVVHLQRGIL